MVGVGGELLHKKNKFVFIIVTCMCKRFIYIRAKATSPANYCIVPVCVFILKQCLSGKKEKNRFRSNIKEP